MSFFTVLRRGDGTRARTGRLELPHGPVSTPVFMPVGTLGTVKAVDNDSLAELGFEIILANTYHLFLRPGPALFARAGGLHRLSGWKGNILTDSGGFQVFSLAAMRKIREEGVEFRSHIDGSKQFLGPEQAVEIQAILGSDIQMQLDVCTPFGAGRKEAGEALRLTSLWLGRSKTAWEREREKGYGGSLFSIVQGNFFPDLRRESAEKCLEADLPGIAIGGLSVGEAESVFFDFLASTAELLPGEKPRYVMGIGTPEYILAAIDQGIDMFDCVLPTRTARNGRLFSARGAFNIKRAEFRADLGPADSECDCKVCRNYSRAWLHHLFRNGEILFSMLASYHNLHFLNRLVENCRLSIENGSFSAFRKSFLEKYHEGKEKQP